MILLSHHKVQQLLFVACLADQYSVSQFLFRPWP